MIRAGAVAAVVGAIAWAIPWLSTILGAESPILWHPAHAVAGSAWAIALLAHARHWRNVGGLIAVCVAAVAAAAFALTNAGEALTGNDVFVLPYGIAMLVLSVAASVAGIQGLRDPLVPRDVALTRIAVAAFPMALLFGYAGLAFGALVGTTYTALVAYGAAWVWFGLAGQRPVVRVAA